MDRKSNWKGWLYLSPALILITLFTLFPIINTFIISFLKDYNYSSGANQGFTFENYGIVLGITPLVPGNDQTRMTEFIRYALPNTLLITFVTVPISVLLSLMIAVFLNRIKKVRSFFQTIFFLPYVTNTIAVGMVFAQIFSSTGLFNSIFGLDEFHWLEVGQTTWGRSMFLVCLYVIWTALPFKILIFASALQNIDKQYYDAARIDSSPRWKTDLKIVFPMISPQILYVSITSFISGFKEYNAIIGLFNRSYTSDGNLSDLYTVVYYIYDQIQSDSAVRHLDYAAAGSVILFVIILAFTLLQMQVSKKRVHY